MKSRMLVLAALAPVLLTGTRLREIAPVSSPAPKRPAAKAPASDPAEPPLKIEARYGAVPVPEQARQAVAVASSARGTRLTLNTPGGWQGQASLTFKGCAPPMRFTLTLARMPSYDLGSLTLVSGKLALAVGPVSATPTTRHFDAAGRAQKAPEGAAYTVTARRWDGELDVELRRAPGAALGKALSVSWQSNIGHGHFLGER
jgi:hypothetical protein